MNNLFVITTPFQLLGALEAIEKFNLKKNLLVIIDNNLENNSNQITYLLENNKQYFDTITRHGQGNKSKFFKNIKLVKNLKKNSIDNIFIGDIGSIQKIIISNIKSNKIFLLDDGAKTILIHKALKEGRNIFKSKGFRKLRFNLVGLKTSTEKVINIFTFFNLCKIDNNQIINHNFEKLKKIYKLKGKKIENKVYILGQPLIENKIVKNKAYEDYINFIINKHNDCKVYYLMHRREEKEKLLSYNLIKEINIIESTQPGEFFFLNLDHKPKIIYGINTTLLFSLVNIFDDLLIYSYLFKQEDILRNKEWFKESIKHFEENRIRIEKGNI
ncbi:hypothetical protein B0F89_1277 [Malaciobacter marinus]|uniref:Uncharacterized protein n=1 Tax=Malaciobacter marinus TaxID=505249 RepID=A0AB36ZVT5_9BACT|nr:polysialyltransferase family glycosyltransferase [Malaciobacter marinus]PPK60186.1 hypothetical protein B0F89_1277 [Malaciobacter marinus]